MDGFGDWDNQIVSEYHPTGKGKCTFAMKKFGRHQFNQGIKTDINNEWDKLTWRDCWCAPDVLSLGCSPPVCYACQNPLTWI